MALPFGVGARLFPFRPLLVRRWLVCGVTAATCITIYLTTSPLTQLWIVLLSSLTVAGRSSPRARSLLIKWSIEGAIVASFGAQLIDANRILKSEGFGWGLLGCEH